MPISVSRNGGLSIQVPSEYEKDNEVKDRYMD